MVKEIDVRGFSCPQPVMSVKKSIDAGERNIIVLANDSAAISNVRRLARNNGFAVEIEERRNETLIKLKK